MNNETYLYKVDDNTKPLLLGACFNVRTNMSTAFNTNIISVNLGLNR